MKCVQICGVGLTSIVYKMVGFFLCVCVDSVDSHFKLMIHTDGCMCVYIH